MKSLTVAYISSRPEPEFDWFLESLANQVKERTSVILVHPQYGPGWHVKWGLNIVSTAPKPTVWQGPHRLTKADWWAASNARNTAICLCKTEWIAFVDDRSVLEPTWLQAVSDAMKGNYAVCGPYQKRKGITVENGIIRHAGIVTGEDNRRQYVNQHWSDPRHGLSNPYACPGSWWYGCSTALPLEWALQINGYDESCDGMSGEDYIFGQMLQNNGFPIFYDLRMGIVEDRTPDKLGPAMIRRDKGVSPNDKSHAQLELLKGCKRAQHDLNIRELRNNKLLGGAWPIPTKPDKDWYDGQPLSEMEPG